eukprot:TRINITY_DN3286_c0_g1_i7.p2 TRINITY_DN3286_c0_g1~~TRINITY_DN3286_c0_g1_i7.p2  ORF type:complete len:131 (-),score=13.98 TRINITY_DN3286_c0_g1_i7:4-396(-)
MCIRDRYIISRPKNDSQFVSGSKDSTVVLWQVNSQKQASIVFVFDMIDSPVSRIVIPEEDDYAYIGYDRGYVVSWDLVNPISYQSRALDVYEGKVLKVVDIVVDYKNKRLTLVGDNHQIMRVYKLSLIHI